MKYVATLNPDGTARIPTQKKPARVILFGPPLSASDEVKKALKNHVLLEEEGGTRSWWLRGDMINQRD